MNLVGQWLGVKSVIGPMRAAGGGSIVNVSSTEGFIGAAGLAAYSASKFGVRGLTKAAARELGRVRHPRQLDPSGRHPHADDQQDPTWSSAKADSADAFLRALPLGRMGEAGEVPGVVVYLASDESATAPAASSSSTAACSPAPATDRATSRSGIPQSCRAAGHPDAAEGTPFHESGGVTWDPTAPLAGPR